MMHNNRNWRVSKFDDKRELAEKLISQTWTFCSAFQYKEVVFANDSTGPCGAQEYGAINAETREQVDSITFGWVDDIERALELIDRCLDYVNGEAEPALSFPLGDYSENLEPADEHGRCQMCR